jgi:hypothetical protein
VLFVEWRGFGDLFAALACQPPCEGIAEQSVLPLAFPRPVNRRPSGSVGDVLDCWIGHDIENRLLCITQYRDKGHGRALARRLAADESEFVTQWLWGGYWYLPVGIPLQWLRYFETRKYRIDQKQSFDN